MSGTDQHIASAYDRDLEDIISKIMKMGGLVEAAILDSAKALETRNLELAEQVRAGDKQIDAYEEEINEMAARTIALRAPVSRDLRMVLSVLKISANLERVGDYAKNMAKRTPIVAGFSRINGTDAALRRMCKEVQLMLSDALDGYIRGDAELAEQVRERDLEVDQMYNALFREFLTFMMEDPSNITSCMHLHFIAKNVERMGDHVTNIAEQTIYLVTGEMPEEDRQKATAITTDVS
ncbi:phosphate signaling complex protein PhoU [Thalassobium sp. R2A62]|jgi:phosphate transport system protein|uniref:phosphate signaling complex protein PhoU n=1 Tax=Thalassobium sp. R2A62 TaxID=633131 RepID=UPI0001B1D183|nr:phosphate signaling complex protein PhoU [Thalassobium sp. R2A62]EET46228.1 phosphate transport system regulatory protein PhoU [Thalassobium sp. R2A62]MDG1339331.1 phosphate signaling complex protein PhoU [Paracoccaceae bacterium]MDG2451288.1 phosphate signaling complex protein PhoU [Paracoccaceae bacterium]